MFESGFKKRQEEDEFCSCRFNSIEDANQKYHWGFECCMACDKPFSKEMVDKLLTLYNEKGERKDMRKEKCSRCMGSFDPALITTVQEKRMCPDCKEYVMGFAHKKEAVNSPSHYRGKTLEAIQVIDDFELDYNRGNCFKYLVRAPHKGKYIEDLQKMIRYAELAIEKRRREDVRN